MYKSSLSPFFCPLFFFFDENGLFFDDILTLGAAAVYAIDALVTWTVRYGLKKAGEWGVIGAAAYLITDTIDGLNDVASKTRIIPHPPRNKGKWTAICRVDDQSIRGETANEKSYAFGFGIDKVMTGVMKKAEKMAKDILGSNNVHHPSCKCTSPTGMTNACGR